ncbi:unnamed protein product [Amoebophrya sp. A120]|nr:unnamed protein product [Amoebophrya sp. A120]|eukprot:GSA120T00016544001.1
MLRFSDHVVLRLQQGPRTTMIRRSSSKPASAPTRTSASRLPFVCPALSYFFNCRGAHERLFFFFLLLSSAGNTIRDIWFFQDAKNPVRMTLGVEGTRTKSSRADLQDEGVVIILPDGEEDVIFRDDERSERTSEDAAREAVEDVPWDQEDQLGGTKRRQGELSKREDGHDGEKFKNPAQFSTRISAVAVAGGGSEKTSTAISTSGEILPPSTLVEEGCIGGGGGSSAGGVLSSTTQPAPKLKPPAATPSTTGVAGAQQAAVPASGSSSAAAAGAGAIAHQPVLQPASPPAAQQQQQGPQRVAAQLGAVGGPAAQTPPMATGAAGQHQPAAGQVVAASAAAAASPEIGPTQKAVEEMQREVTEAVTKQINRPKLELVDLRSGTVPEKEEELRENFLTAIAKQAERGADKNKLSQLIAKAKNELEAYEVWVAAAFQIERLAFLVQLERVLPDRASEFRSIAMKQLDGDIVPKRLALSREWHNMLIDDFQAKKPATQIANIRLAALRKTEQELEAKADAIVAELGSVQERADPSAFLSLTADHVIDRQSLAQLEQSADGTWNVDHIEPIDPKNYDAEEFSRVPKAEQGILNKAESPVFSDESQKAEAQPQEDAQGQGKDEEDELKTKRAAGERGGGRDGVGSPARRFLQTA